MQSELAHKFAPEDQSDSLRGAVGPPQDSLIQDSLTDVDFNFGEKVTVNKNNYTLTYSGQGLMGSFIASMVSSSGALLDTPQGITYGL